MQQHIKDLYPEVKAPCHSLIGNILRKRYHLNFKQLDGATFRYRDPLYDEKRLWVSRLLAQFMLDGALLISIDESNFRADSLKGFSWQFNKSVHQIYKRVAPAPPRDDEPAFSVQGWDEVSSEISQRSLHERNLSRRRRVQRSQSSVRESPAIRTQSVRGRPRSVAGRTNRGRGGRGQRTSYAPSPSARASS